MTWKQIDKRLNELLFKCFSKPLLLIASRLRTNYWLRGNVLTFKRPFSKPISIRIDQFDEIGVETTDQGPFAEDLFWILNHGETRLSYVGDLSHP